MMMLLEQYISVLQWVKLGRLLSHTSQVTVLQQQEVKVDDLKC